MKKKLLIFATTLLLLAFAVPSVYAATTKKDVSKDINALYQQIFDLQKKIIDKRVEGGQLTQDQGNQIKSRLDNAEKYQEQNGNTNGYGYGMMGGYGYGGMMGGAGGFGGCGGYGYNGNNNNSQGNVQPNSNVTGTATNDASNL